MGARLRPLPAAAGGQWIRRAFLAFRRRPALFALLLVATVFANLVLLELPVVGPLLVSMSIPMVSLGFMMVTAWSLADDPEHRRLAATPLAATRAQRRALVGLCALYATCSILFALLCNQIAGDAIEQYVTAASQVDPSAAAAVPATLPMPSPEVWWGLGAFWLGVALMSIPMWHAPALVHWAGQGAALALFSSTLAVWRTRHAFFVYTMGWLGLAAATMAVSALLAAVGLGAVGSLLAVPALFTLFTVFYVSLYFCFVDTFEITP